MQNKNDLIHFCKAFLLYNLYISYTKKYLIVIMNQLEGHILKCELDFGGISEFH